MSATFTFTIDGKEIKASPGQTIMEAAEAAGVYIPRLCYSKDLRPHGSCRVCTCMVNGRPQAACTQPAAAGMVVDNNTDEIQAIRRDLVDMLFVDGNHFCPFCEKSGNCELQAMAYRLGITAPRFPYLWPERSVDASHPEVFIDRNRCILCGRCVNASKDIDGKNVFQFVGRGEHKRVAVNAEALAADTDLKGADRASMVCPVGAIVLKYKGYATPIGRRIYDQKPIGSEIESRRK
ncbi:MAG TPA: 2Fe-2S iron-sulfur cluster-binding protein [Planctomycetota bacterium]|nr:2Fe-2S iron-sulfur cluster-binding protein [Planctomycetota bacterium]